MTVEKPNVAPAIHHYIPIFYSKRWASGYPAKLTRYARWRPNYVAIDRKAPSGVGWERNGYSFDGFQGASAQAVETDLMKPKDDKARKVLARLESGKTDGHWSDQDRFAWTWFMVSLMVRGPEDVRSAKRNIAREWANPNERMEARYQALFDEFPEMRKQAKATLKEYIATMGPDYGKRLAVKIMADMTDHTQISEAVANLHWQVRPIFGKSILLTSDRPVRREYPFSSKSLLMTLPIGPKTVFMAANSADAINRAFRCGEEEFVQKNNRVLVRQARQFVFAHDDRDYHWVRNNLAKEPQAGFFDFIRGTATKLPTTS